MFLSPGLNWLASMLNFVGERWVKLDETDRRILRRIELDARVQNKDLASAIGFTPSGTLHRLRRLEKNKVIVRYLAEINLPMFEGWVTLWGELNLTAHGRSERRTLEERMRKSQNLVEAKRVIGRSDYLLRVTGCDASVWPTLLREMDPDGVLIQAANVQIEDGVAKTFAGSPQLTRV